MRYLEYGDFHLVRESLQERRILLQVAPQFVRPLRLFIPIRRRFGGLWSSAVRFLGLQRMRLLKPLWKRLPVHSERGLWLVRLGLRLYDFLAGAKQLPRSEGARSREVDTPRIDSERYPWMCAYTDAQMQWPERFVIALLEDARREAEKRGVEFQIKTHHRAVLQEGKLRLVRQEGEEAALQVTHRILINATGAWGDFTLKQLSLPSKRLFGGTKGSHLLTQAPRLLEALGEVGVYAEAPDGRLVFVLPFGQQVLVGTTDEPFEQSPERATASEEEIDYLIEMVNHVFPQVKLMREDVDSHYSGVRPLPYVESASLGSISRDYHIERHAEEPFPVLTVVGGKLTTCRKLAENLADSIFEELGQSRTVDTKTRPVPGAEGFPANDEERTAQWEAWQQSLNLTAAQIACLWELFGTRLEAVVRQLQNEGKWDETARQNVNGTALPTGVVRWIIRHEWVETLPDLIERRLLLTFHPGLTEATLVELADCLVAEGKLDPANRGSSLEETRRRLNTIYGKEVVGSVERFV